MTKKIKVYIFLLHVIIFAFFMGNLFIPTRFSFLNWNLFLSLLPFDFSLIAYFFANRFITVVFSGLWLLFFPNSLYMITDYLHLQYMGNNLSLKMQLLNYSILSAGIFLGVILGIFSLELIIFRFFNNKSAFLSFVMIEILSFLSSIGIYLGHFLRINSWDIFTKLPETISIFMSALGEQLFTVVFIFFVLQSFLLNTAHLGILILNNKK